MVIAAAPVAYACGHLGPRATSIGGVAIAAVATLGFAVLDSPAGLDLSRFLQGVGIAAAWSGVMIWLAAAYPLLERGGAMGFAFSTAFVGVLLGPAVGAFAASAGREYTSWSLPSPRARAHCGAARDISRPKGAERVCR
jgi:MFS family permease